MIFINESQEFMRCELQWESGKPQYGVPTRPTQHGSMVILDLVGFSYVVSDRS